MLKKNTNDIIIWFIIIALIFFSFYFFYAYTNFLVITRIVLLSISFIISFFLFIYTSLGNNCWNYIKEAFKEIHFITWPSNKETLQTTLVISGLVILMGTILCLIDVIFFNFIKWAANFG
jgi:preprotein translocase subunit SecE